MLRTFFVRENYRAVFAIMAIGAALGLLASFVLSVDSIELAKNTNAVLTCDINAALSCSSVGRHWTATLLGFPNAFIGMMSFSVLLTVAIAGLMGTKFLKRFMQLAQLGALAGFGFALWMFVMSYSVIGVLCPWCLTTDIATLLVVFAITRYNILEKNLPVTKRIQNSLITAVRKNYDVVAFVSLGLLAALLIVIKFGTQLF